MLCCVRAGLLNNIYRCGVDAITDMVVTKDAVEEVIYIVIAVTRGMHSVSSEP
jgi:hypothetical protein